MDVIVVAISYKKCIKCGGENTLNIVYGYPNYELTLDAMEGKVMLGGCEI